MEKGALLPLKFYPALEWTDYERFTKNMGGDFALFTEHHIMMPAFQLCMPDVGRHWGELDLTTIEIVDYITGDTLDLLSYDTDNLWDVLVNAGSHRNLVWPRFPLYNAGGVTPLEGLYYIHIEDQFSETNWYSEIFRVCDMSTNALSEGFSSVGGWAAAIGSYDAAEERVQFSGCKTGAAEASAYIEIEVVLGEELDLYAIGQPYTPACGAADWNDPVYFELRTTDGIIVSNTIMLDDEEGIFGTLTAEVGGTVEFTMYVLAADTTAIQVQVWLQRRYSAGFDQIRYKHSVNTCKIFYELDYENIFFIDSKQVIDQNSINEDVAEDDLANKYRLVGSNQKWNSLQFASGEAMLNAMSLLRLHDTIKIIREHGEVIDVAEILMEQSVIDYESSTIKLIYREDSCPVEPCGFVDCCPQVGEPIMEGVFAATPAAADYTGLYVMVEGVADQYGVWLSNGAAWAGVAGASNDTCREARQNLHTNGNRFFWYDVGTAWRLFIELDAVNDNADGTANLVTDTEYRDGLFVVGEYQNSEGDWIECTDIEELTAGAGAVTLTTFDNKPGVGTWTFRLHIWIGNCDYGYSNEVSQTIT